MRNFLVRRVLFTPDREEQQVHVVTASGPREAAEKVVDHSVISPLTFNGHSLYTGVNHMGELIEVIAA